MDITALTPSVLDFANHRADATDEDIRTLCKGVLEYGFNSVFVNPLHVAFARKFLDSAGGQKKTKVGTVVSFPLGGDLLPIKVHAIREAVANGADELDIVPDISGLFEGQEEEFGKELRELTAQAKHMRSDVIVKFIIEMGLFTDENGKDVTREGSTLVKQAAVMIEKSGADFVKLCSGMGPRGVAPADVALIRSFISPTMKIKGAGGIDTYEEALALLSAGANRLGTSHAIDIIQKQIISGETSTGSTEE